MKKNRTIPFGYEMKNGEIQPNLIESRAVQTIFESYLQGHSLADIAQCMSESGIPYHETSLIWNKSMVKRILENARYTGSDNFYPLISEETFASANEKKQRKSVNLQPISAEIAALKAMCVCAECGGKISRITGKYEKWDCLSSQCSRFDYRMTDQMLTAAVLQIWNTVQANPSLLDVQENDETYRPTSDIQTQENEVYRLLDLGDPESAKAEIFRLASMKYACCAYDDKPQKTAKLRQILANADQMNTLDTGLLQSTISRIAVSHFCAVTLIFQNGVTIKQTLERSRET